MRVWYLALVISQFCVGTVSAEDANSQVACAATAFKDYLTETQVFRNRHGVEDQIAQRRLQERFCLRFAQCVTRVQGQKAGPPSPSVFADCLREEAIELYRLYRD